MIRKFSVTYVMEVDEDNNFLSSHEEGHTEDVHDLVSNVMHDVDDIRIQKVLVCCLLPQDQLDVLTKRDRW